MKKDFLDWFARAKTKSKVDQERDYVEHYGKDSYAANWGEEFVDPDVFDFDKFTGGKIGGTSIKALVMIKGKYLRELFEEVKNNSDTNFVTCVDDYIKGATWEEFSEYPVSIIGKSARRGDPKFNRSELIYSRLANIFGIKTAFTFALNNDYSVIASVDILKSLECHGEIIDISKDPEKLSLMNHFRSVNIKNGNYLEDTIKSQKLITFADFTKHAIGRVDGIGHWLVAIENKLAKEKEELQMPDDQVEKFIYDFIKTYLVRKYIFRDNDFHGENVNIVHSGDYKDIQLGASIDMEFCGNIKTMFYVQPEERFMSEMQEDLTFLQTNYPEMLQQIIAEINSAFQNNKQKIYGTYKRFTPNEDCAASDTSWLAGNVSKLNEVYANASTPEMKM